MASPRNNPVGIRYEFSRRGKHVDLLLSVRLLKPRQKGDGTKLTIIDRQILMNEKVQLSGYGVRPTLTIKVEAEAPAHLQEVIKRRRHLDKIRQGSPILK